MRPTPLCHLTDIGKAGATPASKGFTLENGREIFIVRDTHGVHGFENRCPHTGAPLDWVPDQFLDLDKIHIQCATHDARFRIADGLCIAGPCAGESLRKVLLVIRDDHIHLAD